MKTEKKAEYTPGPWERSPQSSGCYVRAIDGRNIAGIFTDASTDDRSKRTTYAEAEANARLVAAAPDLLAAANLAFSALDELQKSEIGLSQRALAWEADKALRAAIAKAEGR